MKFIHTTYHSELKNYSADGELQQDAVAWGMISNTLSSDANIKWFGCDAAADDDGRKALDELAEITGKEILASDDTTGVLVVIGCLSILLKLAWL